MFARFSSSMGLVGVDFGTRGIKMLQVRQIGDDLAVVGAARVNAPLIHNHQPKKSGSTPNADAGKATETPAAVDPVATASVQPLPPSQRDVSEQIRAAFVTGGFTGRKCVVSLAREDVCVQSIRLPRMPDDELRQTVAWEAAQRFGFDRNAMEADFIRTGATLASGENREEVIIIAAPHAAIHARVEPVLAAGLRPVAVDTAFAALVRTFSRRVRREADLNLVRIVVEIGASGSTVLILRGDQIAFCKPLAISGSKFNQAVADHLQMSEADAGELRQQRMSQHASTTLRLANDQTTGAGTSSVPALDRSTDRAIFAAVRPLVNELAKEITLCLRYYSVTFRGHPPQRLILTGGDALEPHLDELVSNACKLEVAFDDAPGCLSVLIGAIQTHLNRSPGPSACWAAAMGLSMRGIGSRRELARREADADETVRREAA